MARIARFVVPGLPHHVTQRGNRRETVFFSDAVESGPLSWSKGIMNYTSPPSSGGTRVGPLQGKRGLA
jgi:hypothetical protein